MTVVHLPLLRAPLSLREGHGVPPSVLNVPAEPSQPHLQTIPGHFGSPNHPNPPTNDLWSLWESRTFLELGAKGKMRT